MRRYAAKRLTNDDLDSVDVDWRDRGAVAVKQMAWRLYDDLHTHRATGRFALARNERRTVARWVVFLQSDEEYLWPEYDFVSVSPAMLSFFTLGWWGRKQSRRWNEYMEAGEFEAWPFISKQAEKAASAKPKFLNHADA